MKDLFIFLAFFCLLTACSRTRQLASGPPTESRQASVKSSPEFIDNIAIHVSDGGGNSKLAGNSGKTPVNSGSSAESYSNLQFKYAILENAPVEELTNKRLLEFMEQWYGTQYHYGGNSKDGIDCSAFVSLLMNSVYGINHLPRISRDQYLQSRRISRDEIREGDLVFFHTQGKSKSVTHVGVYLRNNRFVHASVSGVMISDMQEGYYASHYVGAGRVVE